MTAQEPDWLILEGERVALFTNPLDDYLGSSGSGWPFYSAMTSNWRGYVACWEIRDGAFWLVELHGWLAKEPLDATKPLEINLAENLAAIRAGREADAAPLGERDEWGRARIPLERFFPGTEGPVRASWFSGTLRVPLGRRLHYVHMGYGSIHERDRLVTIRNGEVVHSEEVDNRPALAARVLPTIRALLRDQEKHDPAAAAVTRRALADLAAGLEASPPLEPPDPVAVIIPWRESEDDPTWPARWLEDMLGPDLARRVAREALEPDGPEGAPAIRSS